MAPDQKMVSYTEFMSIALDQCAPDGEGTADERREVFRRFAEVWNENKDQLKEMSRSRVRQGIECR